MSKKLIAALICLIIVLLSFSTSRHSSLESASEALVAKMMEIPEAVAVFNLERGVFV